MMASSIASSVNWRRPSLYPPPLNWAGVWTVSLMSFCSSLTSASMVSEEIKFDQANVPLSLTAGALSEPEPDPVLATAAGAPP